MLKHGLTRDIFGELLETGKAIKKQTSQISPGKILNTASKQLFGGRKPKKPEKEDETFEKMMRTGDKREGVFDPTKITDEQLKKMRVDDAEESLKNYREIQKQLLELYLREKQKELPAYQAGKPAAARTYEEEREMIEKKRKEEEEERKKKGIFADLLPKSASKIPKLGIFVKQKKGSKETKLGKPG